MNDYVKHMREKVGHDVIMVVGCGVFVYRDGKVLLQRRKDDGCWAIHGGSMDIGETTEEAARRELVRRNRAGGRRAGAFGRVFWTRYDAYLSRWRQGIYCGRYLHLSRFFGKSPGRD